MRISAIVAMSKNRVIGLENRLPWHLPEDLKRFKQITTGHPIIMGRKTFESIGRILPNRENIILTQDPLFRALGTRVFHDLESAFDYCRQKEDEVFVIGGTQIFQLAFPKLDRMYLTLIHQDFQGDVYFPEFSDQEFKEISREDHLDATLPFSFITLDRIS